MKKLLTPLFSLALLLSLCLPGFAYQAVGTWRAPNGTIMKIYPSFQVYFGVADGRQIWGNGWWLTEGALFNCNVPGMGVFRAELVTNDLLLCQWGGEWVYLQRIAARGADDTPPPDDSWFSGRPDTANSRY